MKSLGDQKTHSLDCLLLSQLSAEMLTAGPGRRVGAEKNCKAATDKLERRKGGYCFDYLQVSVRSGKGVTRATETSEQERHVRNIH